MRCRHWQCSLPLLVVAMAIGGTGCSGSGDSLPREPISGTVTMDGQPLASGAIQFTPAAGANTTGDVVSGGSPITGGKFSIARETGLIPGSYKVAVNSSSTGSAGSTKVSDPGSPRKGADRPKETIPAKYNTETTLTAEVKKGGLNEFKYDLVSK